MHSDYTPNNIEDTGVGQENTYNLRLGNENTGMEDRNPGVDVMAILDPNVAYNNTNITQEADMDRFKDPNNAEVVNLAHQPPPQPITIDDDKEATVAENDPPPP